MRSSGSPLSALARATLPCWVKISPAEVSWRSASRAIGLDTPNSLAISPSGGSASPGAIRPSNNAAAIASDTASASRNGLASLAEKIGFRVGLAVIRILVCATASTAFYNLATKFISCQAAWRSLEIPASAHRDGRDATRGRERVDGRRQRQGGHPHHRCDCTSADAEAAAADNDILGEVHR